MFLPVTGWCDKVKENVDAVVAESWVTLDSRFFGKNVIVLSLEVSNNLGEAVMAQHYSSSYRANICLCMCIRGCVSSYLASLSIWSPNPGVSTTVREMRVPSSSSSSSDQKIPWLAGNVAAAAAAAAAWRVMFIVPTVAGFILTPSSICAFAASSSSSP